MLSLNDAIKIVKKNTPQGNIQAAIIYEDVYVFQVFTDDEFEGQMDPFYSVNIKTGEFRDFSIITDGDTSKLVNSFIDKNLIG